MDYTKYLPTQPPQALFEMEDMKKALSAEALIYKSAWVFDPLEDRNVQMAEVHCSACRETFYLPIRKEYGCRGHAAIGFEHPEYGSIFDGKTTLCPMCDTGLTAYHTSHFGGSESLVVSRCHPMTFHRIEDQEGGKHFAAIIWYVNKTINKYGQATVHSLAYEAYVAEKKKTVKAVGYWKYFTAFHVTGIWEQRKRSDDTFRRLNQPMLPPDPELLIGTEMENSKIDLYLKNGGEYPISYMQVYIKHRNLENLIVSGLTGPVNLLLNQCGLHNYNYRQCGVNKDLKHIDWKKKRPCEMLGMNKQEFDFFRKNCKCGDLDFWALMRRYGAKIQRLPELRQHGLHNLEVAFETGSDPETVFRYLEKQKKRYPKDSIHVTELRDYRNMVRVLGDDMTDSAVLWPQRLKTAHDDATERYTKKKADLDRKAFKERFKTLSTLAFEYEDLLIRPVKSEAELKKEGSALHHCVATYAKKHASGETAIFLIRKKTEPEKAYFTLEFDEKGLKVRQNRGKYNCARSDDVVALEKAWLEWIRGGMKQQKIKEKKNGTAKSMSRAATAA